MNNLFFSQADSSDSISKTKNLFSAPQDFKTSSIEKDLMIFMESGTLTPNLRKIVDSLLTISPTSTSCEKSFSTCGYILTPFRSKMKPDLFDSIVLSRLFYINNLI